MCIRDRIRLELPYDMIHKKKDFLRKICKLLFLHGLRCPADDYARFIRGQLISQIIVVFKILIKQMCIRDRDKAFPFSAGKNIPAVAKFAFHSHQRILSGSVLKGKHHAKTRWV